MITGAIIAAALAAGPVELRGGGAVDAPIEDVSLAGVTVGGAAPRTISWRRVRAVVGDKADEAQPFVSLADNVWRATTRLDRSDVHGALTLLPELESRCAGQNGPTPLDVFSAATEAHRRAGDHPSALRAYLELARLLDDPDDYADHGLDPLTGLSPHLAPFMTEAHARRAAEFLTPNPDDPAPIARLRACYSAAVGANPALLPEGGAESPAELLLGRTARAQAGDSQALVELRAWARDEGEPWRHAWAAAAAARAHLDSPSPHVVRQAALDYLAIPAFYATDAPYLAGLALVETAEALERLGETAPAHNLRSELSRLSPDHPALAPNGDDAP